MLLDADSVTLEPCVPCRPTGSVTLTTYGDDGAAPDSVATRLPPLSTPDEPKLAPSLASAEPPYDRLSEPALTPTADASAAFSSPTVIELLADTLRLPPYVACSAAGSDTTTWLSPPEPPPPAPTLLSTSSTDAPDDTPAPPSV